MWRRGLLTLTTLLAFSVAAHGDTTISNLPAADALDGTEVAPVVQSSTTKKATIDQVITYAGSSFQPLDSDLTIWAGITPSADVQSFVSAASYAAMRALMDLEAGTDFYSISAADATFQPLDSDLTSWAGVTRAPGFDTFVATPTTANFLSLVTDESFVMDSDIGSTVQAYDSDLAAVAALTTTAAGLTSLTFTDPAEDRPMIWDDDTNTVVPGSTSNIATEGSPATGDFVVLVDADDVLKKVDWADLPGGSAVVAGHLYGLTLSNNGSDATNDIDVAAGVATSSDNDVSMSLASAITKQIDASWVVGTNQGCLDGSESSAGTPDTSTWYHYFLIRRSDTGVVDILCSESATSPTLPTNYDDYRRIGSVYNNSSGNIRAFSQKGDRFLWLTPVADVSASNPGTSAVLRTLSVPSGIQVDAYISVYVTSGINIYYYQSSPDATDTTPSISAFWYRVIASERNSAPVFTRTNTSSQVRTRFDASDGTLSLFMLTLGWTDTRGRLN